MTKEKELQAILYEAAASPIGVLLTTFGADPDSVRQHLYGVRQRLNDPTLGNLQIRLSPIDGGELVIVRVRKEEEKDDE